jgi:hypothetical protein
VFALTAWGAACTVIGCQVPALMARNAKTPTMPIRRITVVANFVRLIIVHLKSLRSFVNHFIAP